MLSRQTDAHCELDSARPSQHQHEEDARPRLPGPEAHAVCRQTSGIVKGRNLERRRFYCPSETCNKTYRGRTGLSYHLKRGKCGKSTDQGWTEYQHLDAKGIRPDTDITLFDAAISELEASEDLLKPFVCGIDGCKTRSKRRVGLFRHYQNKRCGHRSIALQRLSSGTHPCFALISPEQRDRLQRWAMNLQSAESRQPSPRRSTAKRTNPERKCAAKVIATDATSD